MIHRISSSRLVATIFLLVAIPPVALRGEDNSTDPRHFETHVRSIFKAHCFHCHGDEAEHEAELDLRLVRFAIRGGDSGPALVPGNVEESLLVARIRDGEMPPGDKKVSAAELALIERWIAAGAKTARPEPENVGDGLLITEEDRKHWSFQPIAAVKVPLVQNRDRVRNPVDAFLLAKLEEQNLSFSPEANKSVLLRRVYFDLTGLPPTPEEAEAFLNDDSADAYERLVERLLESPRYGERWARHWLDVAGYADSEGYTNADPERSWAWKYRDYVIRAFNNDKPFDQFIVEQLAGDEQVGPDRRNLSPEQAEKLVATGFLRMAPDGTSAGDVDKAVASNQVLADTIQIVSSSLQGLTVACAQCHHHRYDPISQDDYYRFRAIFEPAYDWKQWRTPQQRLVSLYTEADRAAANKIEAEAVKLDQQRKAREAELIEQTFEKELAKLPEELRDTIREARETPEKKRNAEQKKLLKQHPSVNVSAKSLYLYDKQAEKELKEMAKRASDLRATRPKEEFVRALTEPPGRVPTTYLFHRGDHEQPKQALPAAELTILDRTLPVQLPQNDPAVPTSGRRLAFARLLTSGKHPLTSRVLVNRIWLHHFGRAIVSTPGDFGALGAPPTHPKLLDWLANDFVSNGWRLKRLHKLLLMSSAYRQQSRRTAELDRLDPDNAWYGRMNVTRLEAEVVRDAMLTVSGQLNPKMYGPPIPVMADNVGQFVIGKENLNAGRPGAVIPMRGEQFRRSLYVQVRRSRPLGMLDTFDAPSMAPNCEQRNASTVATQSLLLMNGKFTLDSAQAMAARIAKEAGDAATDQVIAAWHRIYAREPSDAELARAQAYLRAQAEHFAGLPAPKDKAKKDKRTGQDTPAPEREALASLCHALLSSNEFLYVD